MKKLIALTLILTGCYSSAPIEPEPKEEPRTIGFTWISNDTIEIQRDNAGSHKFSVVCDRSDNKQTNYTVAYNSPFNSDRKVDYRTTNDWTAIWNINVNQDTGVYKVIYEIMRPECDRLEVPGYIYVK